METKNEAFLKALQDAVDGKPTTGPAPTEPPKDAPQTAEGGKTIAEDTSKAGADVPQAKTDAENESAPVPATDPAPVPETAPAASEPKPEAEKAIADNANVENKPASTEEPQKAEAEIKPEVKPETEIETKPAAEPAPVPAKESGGSAVASVIKICIPLTVICIVVSLMLALVNFVTAARIEENAAKERAEAIAILYPDATSSELYETRDGAKIYSVRDNDTLLGACVTVTTNGFGGAIDMMVGVNTDQTISGVRILSMSETPGIGSKTNSDDFLFRYANKRGPFVLGENIDGITGASISSRAVTAGVNAVVDLGIDFSAMAGKYGVAVGALPDHTAETDHADRLELPETKPAETTGPAAAAVPAETGSQTVTQPEPAEITVPVVRTIPELIPTDKDAIPSVRITRTEGETVFEKETEPPEETTEPPADPDLPEEAETTAPPAETAAPEPPAEAPEAEKPAAGE